MCVCDLESVDKCVYTSWCLGGGNWYPWEMRRRERKLEIAERKRKILYIIGRKLKKHQMKGWRSESSWFFPLPPFHLTHSLSFLPINWNMLPLHFCIPLSVLCLTYHDFACVLPHHAGRQMLHTDTHTHKSHSPEFGVHVHTLPRTYTLTIHTDLCVQGDTHAKVQMKTKWSETQDHCSASRSE